MTPAEKSALHELKQRRQAARIRWLKLMRGIYTEHELEAAWTEYETAHDRYVRAKAAST